MVSNPLESCAGCGVVVTDNGSCDLYRIESGHFELWHKKCWEADNVEEED